MRLNPDCTRAILLAVEETCDMGTRFVSNYHKDSIRGDFSADEIAYHVRQCDLSGMLYEYKTFIGGEFQITDLAPRGHAFLANIREDTIWNSVKSVSAKIGTKSLDALVQIASSVVTELIKSQLELR